MTDTAELVYVIRDSLKSDLLRELEIEVEEDSLTFPATDDEEEFTIECWRFPKEEVSKLIDYGYNCTSLATPTNEDLGEEIPEGRKIEFLALMNPDNSPAHHDVDPRERFTVDINSWNSPAPEKFKSRIKEIFEERLMPVVRKNIGITVPHAVKASTVTEGNTFIVHVWSSPVSAPDHGYVVPPQMWGIPVPCVDGSSLGIWADGNPVITEEGDEVAAFDEYNLYIYFDAVETGSESEVAILEKIAESVATQLRDGLEYDLDKVKTSYIKQCGKRVEMQKKNLKKQMTDLETRATELQQEMVRTLREHKEARVRVETFDKHSDDINKMLSEEFDALTEMPKIERVEYRGNSLAVHTKTLFCTDPRTDKVHEIGAFKLVIDELRGDVYFYNKTRKINAYKAQMNGPHLFPDGRACLGNMTKVFPQLISSYEWSAAINMALSFIEHVNVDDTAGAHIDMWPIATDPSKERREAVEEVAEAAEVVTEGHDVPVTENTVPAAATEDAADTVEREG